MNKTKIVNSLITLIVPVVTVITASVAWFMAKNLEKDNGANGSLGLRTYFYQGDGTKDDPYEIVIPQHLYNLSRLQNFGILKDVTILKTMETISALKLKTVLFNKNMSTF